MFELFPSALFEQSLFYTASPLNTSATELRKLPFA